jgi:hypothetical protein
MAADIEALFRIDGIYDILDLRNAIYANAAGTEIDCEVCFRALGWVPFTVAVDDHTPHADAIRDLLRRGIAGQIAAYEPPPAPPPQVASVTKAQLLVELARLQAQIAALPDG